MIVSGPSVARRRTAAYRFPQWVMTTHRRAWPLDVRFEKGGAAVAADRFPGLVEGRWAPPRSLPNDHAGTDRPSPQHRAGADKERLGTHRARLSRHSVPTRCRHERFPDRNPVPK